MKKDWITTGRRPDGICAVAVLVACRCHGSHKTQSEISKLFRISGQTLLDRIVDFRATPSAQLTVEQFHLHDFNVEFDPPAFIKGSKKNQKAKEKELEKSKGDNDNNDDEDDDDNDNKDESDDDSQNSKDDEDIINVNGVKCRKVIIRGVEVNVPLPPDKKKQ